MLKCADGKYPLLLLLLFFKRVKSPLTYLQTAYIKICWPGKRLWSSAHGTV